MCFEEVIVYAGRYVLMEVEDNIVHNFDLRGISGQQLSPHMIKHHHYVNYFFNYICTDPMA